MFNKLNNLKKFNKETITIEKLVSIVKVNPQEELISKIRSVEYKSKEYNNLKLNVAAITPHGIFSGLRNEDLMELSSYLYFDIDGFDTEIELNDTKNSLIENYPISFLCKSVGGKGISFLIKIDTNFELNDTNFNDVYNYVRKMLIDGGFDIDVSANGLVRKMIISSDKDVYFNNEVSLGIDKVSFNNYKDSLRDVKVIKEKKERIHIRPNDTFLNIIEMNQLLSEIKVETLYTKEIEGNFIIDEMDYYKIILPRVIKDGTKHKLYIRLINALYYINPNITIDQVYSYLFYVNNFANPKMNDYKLKSLVINICNYIETTGEIKIKPRVKRLHFNKETKLTKNQKQSMGAQLGAKIKNNKTIELIEKARVECEKLNIVPTQRKVVEMTGLSIATVKRNWNKEYNDLKDIEIRGVEDTIEPKLDEISEDEFLATEKETEIINYKGFKMIEIEKITTEDKKLFISKINDLKEAGIKPNENIILDLKLFDVYKTLYMYDKWLEKYGEKEGQNDYE